MLYAKVLAVKPDYATVARKELEKIWAPELVEHLIEGLRKAGMEIEKAERPPKAPSSVQSDAQPAAATPSIAVLPFANMNADQDEYFSDGLAEEIINALTQVKGLKVIARTSAFAFKGKNEDIRKIAKTLGVSNVLEGSVRRAGMRLRITAQLIQAADGMHLWSQRYDREMTDIFAVQDEISAAIAEQLKVSLAPSSSTAKHNPDVAAYEALLQARHHLYKFSPSNSARALECLKRALAIDPDYDAAHCSMAMYYCLLAEMGEADAREVPPKARASAQKALALDDGLAAAHAALGVVCAPADYNWTEAGNHFSRALQLDRESPEVIYLYAVWYLKSLGRLDEAMIELNNWRQRDPLSVIARNESSWNLVQSRQFESGAAMAQQALELEPHNSFALFCLLEAKIGQGRFEKAIVLAEEAAQGNRQWIVVLAFLGIAYANRGRADDARRVLAEMYDLSAKGGYLHSNAVAAVHAALGEFDTTIDLLNQAIDQRELIITNLKTWQLYDGIRNHPRYPALLKRMNL